MKIPKGLEPLIEDGVIDSVVRSLRSGKEASVYIVRCGTEIRCAKVYKDMGQRSFQARAQYQEGRKVRGSRHARAMDRSTRYGKKERESAWKSTEVDALYKLALAGVRVPAPHGFFSGVLLMDIVVDAEGRPAPNLGEVALTAELAREYHRFLIGEVARMLCAGVVHGDLSEYNVLVGVDGPVIIDFPQVVSATGNNNARAMLLRDVNNLSATLGQFAPELLETHYAEEMWALFERGLLLPDSPLTGDYVEDDSAADVEGTMLAIEDAREEAERRQLGRIAAEQS